MILLSSPAALHILIFVLLLLLNASFFTTSCLVAQRAHPILHNALNIRLDDLLSENHR